MRPICFRLNLKSASDATTCFFLCFSNFLIFFFFGFFYAYIYVQCDAWDSIHQRKHDQILDTSPKLCSHSLCVRKYEEIPKREINAKKNWYIQRKGDDETWLSKGGCSLRVVVVGSDWRRLVGGGSGWRSCVPASTTESVLRGTRRSIEDRVWESRWTNSCQHVIPLTTRTDRHLREKCSDLFHLSLKRFHWVLQLVDGGILHLVPPKQLGVLRESLAQCNVRCNSTIMLKVVSLCPIHRGWCGRSFVISITRTSCPMLGSKTATTNLTFKTSEEENKNLSEEYFLK